MFFICIRGDGIGFRRPGGFRLILPRTSAVPAGNFSDLPRPSLKSYALGVKRPSPTEIHAGNASCPAPPSTSPYSPVSGAAIMRWKATLQRWPEVLLCVSLIGLAYLAWRRWR